jgi:hypothetical protein
MTTNLHDKMLAAIDAYFSASDGTEAEVAENLLLDVRDEINKQKYVPETNFGNMAEPKIGCVNHDCDKCKAVQEPLGYIASMAANDLRASIYRDVTVYGEDLEDTVAIYTTPPATQPAVQEGRDWSLLEATQESLREHMAEIKRLKAAQPAPVQEPVAWVTGFYAGRCVIQTINPAAILPVGIALYTAPQPVPVKTYHDGKPWPVAPKPWVGLTDEEVWDLWNSHTEEPFPEWFVDFKQAYKPIEAKLKEKNHG